VALQQNHVNIPAKALGILIGGASTDMAFQPARMHNVMWLNICPHPSALRLGLIKLKLPCVVGVAKYHVPELIDSRPSIVVD
jgi:hypothetical protein